MLAADLAAHGLPGLGFAALALWLAGIALYGGIVVFVAYRLAFLPLAPADFTPPYWITMGAMAISTLAGARIAVAMPRLALARFVEGATLLGWAIATAWIPLLVALTLWRHGWARTPLRYEPLWWSAVFPIAMYAAATSEMSRVLGIQVPYAALVALHGIALAAWALVFAGLVRAVFHRRLANALRGRPHGRALCDHPGDSSSPEKRHESKNRRRRRPASRGDAHRRRQRARRARD